MTSVLTTAAERPAARAKGTVRPSAMPITTSRTDSVAVKCFSICGVAGMTISVGDLQFEDPRRPASSEWQLAVRLGRVELERAAGGFSKFNCVNDLLDCSRLRASHVLHSDGMKRLECRGSGHRFQNNLTNHVCFVISASMRSFAHITVYAQNREDAPVRDEFDALWLPADGLGYRCSQLICYRGRCLRVD